MEALGCYLLLDFSGRYTGGSFPSPQQGHAEKKNQNQIKPKQKPNKQFRLPPITYTRASFLCLKQNHDLRFLFRIKPLSVWVILLSFILASTFGGHINADT